MVPWWHDIWDALKADFSDLPDVAGVTQLALRMFIAALLGAILGFERESHGKDAGLRTHVLVSLGAALFVLIPQQAGMSESDLSRIIQGIVTGIGFVGAGAILKLSQERRIEGLTTAAGIWLTAAIGIAAGLGRETSAVLGTVFAMLVLAAQSRLGRSMGSEQKANPHAGRPDQVSGGREGRSSGSTLEAGSEDET